MNVDVIFFGGESMKDFGTGLTYLRSTALAASLIADSDNDDEGDPS